MLQGEFFQMLWEMDVWWMSRELECKIWVWAVNWGKISFFCRGCLCLEGSGAGSQTLGPRDIKSLGIC